MITINYIGMMRASILVPIWIAYKPVIAMINPTPIGVNCELSYYELWGNHFLCNVNETTIYGWYEENNIIDITCSHADDAIVFLSVDSNSRPIFPKQMLFKNIKISTCLPGPGISYADILPIFNIDRTIEKLFLKFNDQITFYSKYFTGLHIQSLEVEVDVHENMYFDINSLKSLDTLREVDLAPMILTPWPEWNRFESITLWSGEPEKALQPWGECSHLKQLTITSWHVEKLPNRWLSNCSFLHTLQLIEFEHLHRLPLRMLEGVHSLRSLTVSSCQLTDLPKDLFSYTKELRFLDISDNNLLFESSKGIFSSLHLLEELNLSSNRFFIPALPELASLKSLRALTIDNSFKEDISTLDNSEFKWPVLLSLEQLSLQQNPIFGLRPEWHETMPSLKVLNLTESNITILTYQDMLQIREGGWEVDLRGNLLEAIWFDQKDYEAAKQKYRHPDNNANNTPVLWIDTPSDCNCQWYWFLRLLRERPTYVSLPELQCSQKLGITIDDMPFMKMSLKRLLCELDESECVPGCVCYRRAPDNMTFVNCTGAGLEHIPKIKDLYELHFDNNHVGALHPTDLPDTLTYLDLQYNRLTSADEETVSKMFSNNSRSYHLAGNPILCDCKSHSLIDALHRHSNLVIDFENVTCVDKRIVKELDANDLCLANPVPIFMGVIGVIAFLLVILLLFYYRYKFEVDRILHRYGCTCFGNIDEHEDTKIYDVFISFAHGDAPLVIDELVPGIEKMGIKVCVHYRDWTVGEWIPAQIARSVKESRRTLIVLSRKFLTSVWALLEFRTAHLQALKDRRSRLIVILLENAAAVIDDKQIDKELRSYLVTNTYINWGDNNFWEKLQKALPDQVCTQRKESKDALSGEDVIELMKVNDPPIKIRKDNDMSSTCNGTKNDVNNTLMETNV